MSVARAPEGQRAASAQTGFLIPIPIPRRVWLQPNPALTRGWRLSGAGRGIRVHRIPTCLHSLTCDCIYNLTCTCVQASP